MKMPVFFISQQAANFLQLDIKKTFNWERRTNGICRISIVPSSFLQGPEGPELDDYAIAPFACSTERVIRAIDIDLLSADERENIINVLQNPEREILVDFCWFALAPPGKGTPFVQASPQMWDAWGDEFMRWKQKGGTTAGLGVEDWQEWDDPAHRHLNVTEFDGLESATTVDLKETRFRFTNAPAAAVGFKGGKIATFGLLPDNWKFDGSGEIRARLGQILSNHKQ